MSAIEVSEGDREAALAWLLTFFTIDEALIDRGHKDSLAQAFAAHRIAALEAERERIKQQIAEAHDENIRQGSNRVYGLMAVLDMMNLDERNHQPSEAT